MKDYNLVDIHFHTNDSFDAYEHNRFEKYDIDLLKDIISGAREGSTKVDLLCKTDHNILGYKNYLKDKEILEKEQIVYLPGIEVRGNSSVHWIFIFDPHSMAEVETGKSGSKGFALEEKIIEFFDYDKSKSLVEQAKIVQPIDIEIFDFITLFHDIGIKYLAIPHLNKSGGIWKQKAKHPELVSEIIGMLNDDIIIGLESKKQAFFLRDNIQQTMDKISSLEEKLLGTSDFESTADIRGNITRRNEHLLVATSLNEAVNANGCSVIYGSDFHGKETLASYEDVKKHLFYVHSECSFDGLRLSLLDQRSRIQSVSENKRLQKTSNHVIDKVILEVNNVEKIIDFGDGLNSIIGARGSGKSFLLNAIIGTLKSYEDSKISKDIIIKSIIMQNGVAVSKLEDYMYDYIGQKGAMSNKDKTPQNKSFYNLLASAPYDVNSFENEIRNLNFTVIEDNKIDVFFSKLNNLIRQMESYVAHKEKLINLSFIADYNKDYMERTEEQLIYSKVEDLVSFMKEISKINLDDTIQIETIITSIQETNVELSKLLHSKNRLVLDRSNDINRHINTNNEMIQFYSLLKENIDANLKNRINVVKKRSESVNQYMKINIDTKTSSNQEYLRLLSDTIITGKRMFMNIEFLLHEFVNTPEKLSNTSSYFYSSGSEEYTVKIERNLNLHEITIEQQKDIFRRFNLQTNDKRSLNIIQDLIGKDYFNTISRLLSLKDGRYTEWNLDVPELQPHMYLNKNSGEFENWETLSPGERSRYLLDIVLQNDSNKILILDQPEDDLDNSTIVKVLVERIRTLKQKRQVIVVTHNGNIVLNGDSDRIIVNHISDIFDFNVDTMESKNTYSINKEDKTVLESATKILEGGRQALKMRVKRIGDNEIILEENQNEDIFRKK